MPDPASPNVARSSPTSGRRISGRAVVISMFAFGIVMTSGMWIYWHLYLRPFYPLQRALADEFRESYPRVEGGHHKHSPWTLRIVLQVPFKPVPDDPQVQQLASRVLELARANHDLTRYQLIELYLLQPDPERTPTRIKLEYRVADILER